MKKLNVLYLIRTWALGGSHTILLLLLKHLPRELFNIIVVPYDTLADQEFIDAMRGDGHEPAVDRIPWRGPGTWLEARRKVDELIAKYNIDLLHAHDTNSIVLSGIGRKRWQCACVASPYGWWDFNRKARVYHWIEKNLALPNFERVITVSNTMKKAILEGRTAADRIRVVHTGLDLAKFDQGAPREQVRQEFNIPADACVIGTVSRLWREKGHRYLLDAAHSLMGEFPNIRLLLVGTGDVRAELENQAREMNMSDNVIFTGFYQDLPGALRAMDIFAQPSVLHEGFPTSVLEAQVMRLPVVASDIGGTYETIDVGKTGVLAPPGDVPALANALRPLIADAGKRHEMGQAARAWIERSFTLEGMMGQISDTYIEAVEIWRR